MDCPPPGAHSTRRLPHAVLAAQHAPLCRPAAPHLDRSLREGRCSAARRSTRAGVAGERPLRDNTPVQCGPRGNRPRLVQPKSAEPPERLLTQLAATFACRRLAWPAGRELALDKKTVGNRKAPPLPPQRPRARRSKPDHGGGVLLEIWPPCECVSKACAASGTGVRWPGTFASAAIIARPGRNERPA